MTQDEMIKMARKAGGSEVDWVDPQCFIGLMAFEVWELERFAALVAAAEREACAKVCEERGKGWLEVKNARTIDEGCMHAAAKAEATALAAAIRERGEK